MNRKGESLFCAVMKKTDSYKANVIKADKIVDSGKPVSLFHILADEMDDGVGVKSSSLPEEKQKEKLQTEMTMQFNRVSEESYKKGFAAGMEAQKKEEAPVLEALSAMMNMIPAVRNDVIEKQKEQTVQLAIAIAEKILNQEVAQRKDVILGVLQGVLKNITETDGMKIRLNQQDFRFMMEAQKDFLPSFDGVRNVVFEEDASIKRGGAIVETMFGEVDARLESQLEEIKKAMLKI